MGVGNTLCGDDGFGPQLIAELKPTLGKRAIDGSIAPENWAGYILKIAPKNLIIADAVTFEGEPGEIGVFSAEDMLEGLPATHGPGMGLLFDYLMKQLPSLRIIILAVNPVRTGLGNPLSPEIKKSMKYISKKIINLLDKD